MTQKTASHTKQDTKATAMNLGGLLQRAAVSAAPITDVAPGVHEVLRSSGRPLDPVTRAFMEPRFGHDFSGVRVHTDDQAAASAHAVQARAYTVGSDVVFGAGNYSPETTPGRQLLAHELTHVVQQSYPETASASALSAAEGEAEQSSQALALGRQAIPVGHRIGIGLARAMETKNLSKLSDEELEAEHRRVQVWLGGHSMVELDYGPTQDYLQLIEAEVLRRNPSTNNTPSGSDGGKAATQASATPGKSQLAPVKPDIAKMPGNLYVDMFTSVIYDLDYRAEGGKLSEWLKVNYTDGAVIDININDILEKSMSSEDGRNAMAQGHVGAGGRIFPSELNPRTTPGLYAAKQSAIEAMEESNINFMKAALPAVIFVITIPVFTMGMNKPPAATRTAVPRVAAKVGAAANTVFDAGKVAEELVAAAKPLGNPGKIMLETTTRLARMAELAPTQKVNVILAIFKRIGFGISKEGVKDVGEYLIMHSEDSRYAFKVIKASGEILYGKFDMTKLEYLWTVL